MRLDLEQPTCTCKDFETRGQKCKHVFAVEYVSQREADSDGTTTTTEAMKVTETVTKTDAATDTAVETVTETTVMKKTVAPADL